MTETLASDALGGGRRAVSARLFCVAMIALLAVGGVVAVSAGSTPMDWRLVVQILGRHLLPDGWVAATGLTRADDLIVWNIRAPRVMLCFLVGASLSVAGAQMQAIFRNPLAEPGLVGVGSGAALGGVLAFTTGAASLATPVLPVSAFSGGLLALLLVYALATRGGYTSASLLLLTGVAVGAVLGSVSAFVISLNLANFQMTQQILFWTMGGLDNRMWVHVWMALPFIAAGLLMAALYARDLDVLAQGEDTAAALGVNVEQVKFVVMIGAALLTGASVAVAGMVSFVGLIVPHGVRLMLGPSHVRLIPASALAGAVFLLLCDFIARTIRAPEELRLGVITALWGGPFFVFLLYRRSIAMRGER
ncbi:iron complex transport system permease protein [Rhodoblastus acidophilus]|nr:iron ABC transporter permease [Rhodoblastus acidophilus]MCW2274823.1 iron complex transport system permease protein [Rhodoblastus acidophilus]